MASVIPPEIVKGIEDHSILEIEKLNMIWTAEGIKPVSAYEQAPVEGIYQVLQALGLHQLPANTSFYSRREEHLESMKKAFESRDERKIGKLFGFPECCIEQYLQDSRNGHEAGALEGERIKKFLREGRDPPVYYGGWVHCDGCLTSYHSPSWHLEERMGKAIKKNSKLLYDEYMSRKDSKHQIFELPDGREILGLLKTERTG